MIARLVPLALLGGSALFAPGCAASPSTSSENQDLVVHSGEEALRVLMEGNERFVTGHCTQFHESMVRRKMLEAGQHPFAVILGCADSRVVPEILFDIGLGDVFVIRVAGNLPGPDESGSIEYAIAHLHTPLVLVLGHESCGAVTGAFLEEDPTSDEMVEVPEELHDLLAHVRESLVDIDPDLPLEQRVHQGVEANVRHSIRKLVEIRERLGKPENEQSLLVGAVYELETGRVRLIDLED